MRWQRNDEGGWTQEVVDDNLFRFRVRLDWLDSELSTADRTAIAEDARARGITPSDLVTRIGNMRTHEMSAYADRVMAGNAGPQEVATYWLWARVRQAVQEVEMFSGGTWG